MGIKTRTVVDYYCDVCDAQCEAPSHFQMIKEPGDRNLGHSYIYAMFRCSHPLKSGEDCVICTNCKKDYLAMYLAHLQK